MKTDLSGMPLETLRDLEKNVATEIQKRSEQERATARAQILAIAETVGVPLIELIGGGVRGKMEGKKPVSVRYRHPGDSSKQWTGRGRQPKWLKHWVDEGKSLDQLKV